MKSGKTILAIILFLVTAYIGWDIADRSHNQLLWGWRPFFLWITFWGGTLLLIHKRYSKVPDSTKLLVLSTLSGILLSLSFPPMPTTALVFIALVPLFIVEDTIYKWKKGAARWQVFKFAFNAFLIWNICTTWWVLNTSFVPGIVANVLNAIIMATVFTCIHQIRVLLDQKWHWVILLSIWISFEYLHLLWEISWPWLTLGHYFAEYPSWVQWYEFTGVFGGSAWILGVNFLAWKVWKIYRKEKTLDQAHFFALVGLILSPIAFSVGKYYAYPIEEGNVEIAIVQPNFEPHYQKFRVPWHVQLDTFLNLSHQIVTPETDYIVFPETSFSNVRLNAFENDRRVRRLRQFVQQFPRLHLVTGVETIRIHDARDKPDIPSLREQIEGRDTTFWDVQNTALQLHQSDPIDPYFKSKLVPGAETFPFKDVLPFLKPLIRMLQGSVAGITTQDHREVFHSDVATIAPAICYESIYGAYVGDYIKLGADIIFIVTNDGWWDNTPGHVQHLKLATLRAVEHRRPIVRSANTGISCFINQRGDILQPTKYDKATAIIGKVDPGKGMTFYTKWGDLIARITVFMTILLVAMAVVKAWQNRIRKK